MASNHHPSIAFAFGSRNPFWSVNREVDVYKSTINTVEVKSQLHLWIVISCDIVGRAAWNLYNSSGKREASLAFLPPKNATHGDHFAWREQKNISNHISICHEPITRRQHASSFFELVSHDCIGNFKDNWRPRAREVPRGRDLCRPASQNLIHECVTTSQRCW